MSNDSTPRSLPHERQTDSSLHPSHVDTGGVEMYASEAPEGTDANVVYYQGVVGALNHEGDFSETWHPRKTQPQTEHDWTHLHRPDQWQALIATDTSVVEQSLDLVGFNARSVIVHNWSTQFVYLPDARCWVPPGTFNAVIPLPFPSSVARFIFAQPPGVVQPGATATENVVTLWTERLLEMSAGLQVPSLVQPAVVTGGSTVEGQPNVLVVSNGPTPTAANILDGFFSTAATATSTLITVPAGRTWIGQVGISAAISNSAAVATTGTASAVITTANGTGVVTPAAGSVARVDAIAAANAATGLTGSNASAAVDGQRLVVQASNAGTALVQLVATVTNGTAAIVNGWAIGELQ